MSNYGAGVTPGWYHAEGDPPGTHRYWDGSVWRGDPVAIPAAASPYGSPYEPLAPSAIPLPPLQHDVATYGRRALGWLIDLLIFVPVLGFVGFADDGSELTTTTAETISGFVLGATYLLHLANVLVLQGITGQSVGKMLAGTQIVHQRDGTKVGFGLMLARLLIVGVLSAFTCSLYIIIDWISPAWDRNNERITDKMLKLTVVNAVDDNPSVV